MPSKRVPFKKLLLGTFIVIGLGIVLFGAYLFFIQPRQQQTIVTEPVKETPRPLHSKPNAVRLVISGIKLDLPVTEGKIVDGVWLTTKTGVSHLDISANPGENGNIVIYGHNLRLIFGSLPYVGMGSIVKVIAEDGAEYHYKVYSKRTVKADDISIATATPGEVLTLYTCDGPLDSTRFVLQAEPIKE